MKKTVDLFAIAALFAIASAFATKAFNTIGWADLDGSPVDGPVNSPGCGMQPTGFQCYIVIDGMEITPLYDKESDIGISSKILRYSQ